MYRRQLQKENVTISLEELVPQNHLLRIIDKAIDFNFIYDEVENLYSDKGRLGIDPVSLFKIVFIQYLFGIRSMRQTIKEIEVNVAYRWFIGYSLTEPVPHDVRKKLRSQICRHKYFRADIQENIGRGTEVRLCRCECDFYRFDAYKCQ